MSFLNYHEKEYNKKGFTIARGLFSKNEIKKLILELNIIKQKVKRKKNNQFFHMTKDGKINTIHNIQRYHKKGPIIDIPKNKNLKRIISKLLNDKPIVRNIEFFLKPKKTGMPSPFHQDNFYWNIISAKALNVWIACSKANKKNGGVCYLESSHFLGTLNHESSTSKGSSQKITNKILNKLLFKKKFPNLNPGDCIIHHPEVIHGSKKNTSDIDRVGFVVSFQGKNSKVDIERQRIYQKNLKKFLKKIYS